jgi:hypothetical protein
MLVDQVKFSFKRKMVHCASTGLVALLILSACDGDKKPAEILSEPEMVRVLSEIYLAEEKAGNMGISYDSVVKLFPKFEAKIFEKTGVSDSIFKVSLEYYKSNPAALEHIYTALVDSLNLKAEERSLSDTSKNKNVLSR